jgi:hypothetical protein
MQWAMGRLGLGWVRVPHFICLPFSPVGCGHVAATATRHENKKGRTGTKQAKEGRCETELWVQPYLHIFAYRLGLVPKFRCQNSL